MIKDLTSTIIQKDLSKSITLILKCHKKVPIIIIIYNMIYVFIRTTKPNNLPFAMLIMFPTLLKQVSNVKTCIPEILMKQETSMNYS